VNDLERQNIGFYGLFWRSQAATQVYINHKVAPRNYRYAIQIDIWYLYINLAWTPQFSAELLYRNCCRLSRVSWALAQISCLAYAFARTLNQHLLSVVRWTELEPWVFEHQKYRAVDGRTSFIVRTVSGRMTIRTAAVARECTVNALWNTVTWHATLVVRSWRSRHTIRTTSVLCLSTLRPSLLAKLWQSSQTHK